MKYKKTSNITGNLGWFIKRSTEFCGQLLGGKLFLHFLGLFRDLWGNVFFFFFFFFVIFRVIGC